MILISSAVHGAEGNTGNVTASQNGTEKCKELLKEKCCRIYLTVSFSFYINTDMIQRIRPRLFTYQVQKELRFV